MSVHRKDRKWCVRWRDARGQNRSRSFDRKADASEWDTHVRRLRQRGDLAQLDAGTETLGEFVEEWWRLHAKPNLAPKTRTVYASQWDTHIEPALGHVRLKDVNVLLVQRWLADLDRAGVGLATRHRSKSLLSGVIQLAVEWGRIPTNPVRLVRLPTYTREREVPEMPPVVVEAMRAHWLARKRLRDATLVSVLAYVGPRPMEALGVRWTDIGERTLMIHGTKTSRRYRAARLMAPVRSDLLAWRLACGRPEDSSLIFPRADGNVWTEGDYRNWRRRVYQPTARAVGVPGSGCPYDLRHAAASLWIHEGRSAVEVADWLGHAPSKTWDTYSHVFKELSDAPRVSAEEAIRQARERSVVPAPFPAAEGAAGA